MTNDVKIFVCVLCKKRRSHNLLASVDKKGHCICQPCVDEIQSSFSNYIDGKAVTKKEFDEFTKKKKKDGNNE